MTFQAHLAYPYIISTVVAKTIGIQLSLVDSIVLLVSSVIPDLDYIFVWLKDRINKFSAEIPDHHTWITHTPFYYLILSVIITFISLSTGILFFIGTFLHFIMDMFYTGDGVRWLRPFSNKEFYVNNPTRGKYRKVWLEAYQKLPIWRIDFVFLVIALIIFVNEYIK